MYVRSRGFGAVSTNPGIQTIAATIQQVEGYYPGSLAYTNNNPGNLIYVGQAGATPGAGGFAAFPSYDAGYQALQNQIQNYANRGLTIDQMMAIYAPAGQGSNNPSSYAATIANNLGVSTDTPLSAAIAGASPPSGSSFLDSLSSDFTDLTDSSASGTIDPMLLWGGVLLAALGLYAVIS
jgi:hypothetical protein